MNTEIEQAASVAGPEKADRGEIVTRSALQLPQNSTKGASSNRKDARKLAYLIVRGGRPFFYMTVNRWDRRSKTIKTTKKYLGVSLPKGYRLRK